MDRIFVDSSAWIAYANRADPDHARVCETLQGYRGRRITSSYVFDETVTFCRYRFGHQLAVTIGDAVLDQKAADLIRVTPGDEREAWNLLKARPDQFYSFTDCTSFVLMKRLGVKVAAALDPDFVREGFTVLPADR